jgi:uncharacterized protein YjiS (DUF1127 family)
MEQLEGDRISSKLEASTGAELDGSRPESSRAPLRRAMSWLATTTIEGFAAAGQAMYPVCPITDQAREQGAEPTLQTRRQAEPPGWLYPVQSSSFDDSLPMVSIASFGWTARARSRVVRVWSALCREQRQCRRATRELEALDDRTLRDVGIHRCDIKSVVRYGSNFAGNHWMPANKE